MKRTAKARRARTTRIVGKQRPTPTTADGTLYRLSTCYTLDGHPVAVAFLRGPCEADPKGTEWRAVLTGGPRSSCLVSALVPVD